ncbi:MAG: serine/threonine-protein kinase [Myxococcota bacterium]
MTEAVALGDRTAVTVSNHHDPPAHGTPESLSLGQRLGRYVLGRRLGMGGSGVVYAAYDLTLERQVALKLLLPGRDDATRVRRLADEARAMARLSHPNIVPIYDVGSDDGRPFIAMKLCEGGTMRSWLAEQRPSPGRIVDAMIAAAQGLAAAHEVGLLHRDFKLDNVLVDPGGHVMVADFGLAATFDPTHHARATAGVGSLVTMAPEQHAGEVLGPAVDQYALCVSLFIALFGVDPFAAEGPEAMAHAKRTRALVPVDRSRVPRRIWSALRRGLCPDPARRFGSMRALVARLRPPRRGPRLFLVGAATVAIGIASTTQGGLPPIQLDDPCTHAAATTSWSTGGRDAVMRGLASTEATFASSSGNRVDAVLSDYAKTWSRAWEGACRSADHPAAGRGLSLDNTVACLHRARLRADALVDVLADADTPAARHAARAAESLPDPSGCWTTAGLPWGTLAQGGPAFERWLAEAEAQYLAGRPAAALERADSAIEVAQRHGTGSAAARARLQRGVALTELARYPEATDALRKAYFDAVVVADDTTALQAAVALLRLKVNDEADLEAAEGWSRAALARSARLQVEGEPWAAVIHAQAELAARRGELETWVQLHRRALEVRRDLRDGPSLAVAASLEGLGRALMATADLDGGRRALEEALAVRVRLLGTEHPSIAIARNNYGIVLARSQDQDGARAELEEALRIHEATQGPVHPRVGRVLANLGAFAMARGELETAIGYLDRSVAVLRETLGPSHPETMQVRQSLAVGLDDAGRNDRALVEIEALVRDLETTTMPPVRQGWVYLGLAIIELSAGNDAAALRALEPARALAGDDAAGGELRSRIVQERMKLAMRAGRHQHALELGYQWLANETSSDEVMAMMMSKLEARAGHRDEARRFARWARARMPWWRNIDGHRGAELDDWIAQLDNHDAATIVQGIEGAASTMVDAAL